MTLLYCGECGESCEVSKVDGSYSHEFGTEKVFNYQSSCCKSYVYEEGTCKILNEAQLESIWEDRNLKEM